MDEEDPTPLGVVVEEDRGSLPFALIHGEALVAAAAWALGEAGVQLVDLTVPWAAVREAAGDGAAYVLHDSLCPMTPPDFIARCVGEALASDCVVVGVRPVTDTVKRILDDGSVGATVDRDGLVEVCSPVVLPPAVVAATESLGSLDLAVLVHDLAGRYVVRRVEAPSAGRRVASADDIALLEALTSKEPSEQPAEQRPG